MEVFSTRKHSFGSICCKKNWIECKNNINKYTSIIAYKTKKATHLSVSCLVSMLQKRYPAQRPHTNGAT